MSDWPSAKARRVPTAPIRIGWREKRRTGSHLVLARSGFPDFVFAFHDEAGTFCDLGEHVRPQLLAVAPDDL
ncbi:MAG: type II toxin-antitoxin system HicA family toxin [Terriglobales bacterium]